jgi:hypothetical protein
MYVAGWITCMKSRVSIFMLLEVCFSLRLNWIPGMTVEMWEESAPGSTRIS